MEFQRTNAPRNLHEFKTPPEITKQMAHLRLELGPVWASQLMISSLFAGPWGHGENTGLHIYIYIFTTKAPA